MDPHTAAVDHEPTPFAALRRFVKPRRMVERCELCAAELGPEHPHLIDPEKRQLQCACEACSILFSERRDGRYLRVPVRCDRLSDLVLSDEQWEGLHLPINLAFFYRSSTAGRVVAMYPSPAGATESLLTLESWQELADANPVLRALEPDVEALLVNRVSTARSYFRVSIDECYRLVGLIRTHWRGLSGGPELWGEIGQFFERLRQRSTPRGSAAHG